MLISRNTHISFMVERDGFTRHLEPEQYKCMFASSTSGLLRQRILKKDARKWKKNTLSVEENQLQNIHLSSKYNKRTRIRTVLIKAKKPLIPAVRNMPGVCMSSQHEPIIERVFWPDTYTLITLLQRLRYTLLVWTRIRNGRRNTYTHVQCITSNISTVVIKDSHKHEDVYNSSAHKGGPRAIAQTWKTRSSIWFVTMDFFRRIPVRYISYAHLGQGLT